MGYLYNEQTCGACSSGGGTVVIEHYNFCNYTRTRDGGWSGYKDRVTSWAYVDAVLQSTTAPGTVSSYNPDDDNERATTCSVDNTLHPWPDYDDYILGPTGYLSSTQYVQTDIVAPKILPDLTEPIDDRREVCGSVECSRTFIERGEVTGAVGAPDEYHTGNDLSEPWTEEEVIAALEPTINERSWAQARWQLRTGNSWLWASSQWSIMVTGLVEGVTYEVRPVMRESVDVVGQPHDWDDVDVSWERFTATATDAANGREIEGDDLEPVRGMITEITGAQIRIIPPTV